MNVEMQLKSGSLHQSSVTMLLLMVMKMTIMMMMMMMTVPEVLGHSAARYQVGFYRTRFKLDNLDNFEKKFNSLYYPSKLLCVCDAYLHGSPNVVR